MTFHKRTGGIYMQNAAYGVYKKGRVIFNELVNAPDESNVIVVFLDEHNMQTHHNNKLLNIFDTLGAWEDTKDTETIIGEIENSRISKTAEIII